MPVLATFLGTRQLEAAAPRVSVAGRGLAAHTASVLVTIRAVWRPRAKAPRRERQQASAALPPTLAPVLPGRVRAPLLRPAPPPLPQQARPPLLQRGRLPLLRPALPPLLRPA